MPASRKRVSRSPYQSRRPETKNSVANAAVSTAFTFWPALKRPWGACVWPARNRRSSRSKTSISRTVSLSARRFPSSATSRIAPAQEIPVQKWMSLISGRRAIASENEGM